MNKWVQKYPQLQDVAAGKETVWINPDRTDDPIFTGLTIEDVREAEARLARFAPLIARLFPETGDGIIESDMKPLSASGVYLKQDNALPVAGSIKARGGIYEVLHHTELLAKENGLLSEDSTYASLADHRDFFSQFTVQVGSTGNLGLSIGIMSAVLGYKAIVHMSHDAKQWKKDLLRSYGVDVREYLSDYSIAVQEGRRLSAENHCSYFVDDENSKDLFLGYAVAALRLQRQFESNGIAIDEKTHLVVYIPCGVGGAPGGIAFGLRCVFGRNVHIFFAEPIQAPCMLCGMATGLHNGISVQDIGLTGKTAADGLAVGRASAFVGKMMSKHISGVFTVDDAFMLRAVREIYEKEHIFLEPSACAGLAGLVREGSPVMQRYFDKHALHNAIRLVWATGGRLVPASIREQYLSGKFD